MLDAEICNVLIRKSGGHRSEPSCGVCGDCCICGDSLGIVRIECGLLLASLIVWRMVEEDCRGWGVWNTNLARLPDTRERQQHYNRDCRCTFTIRKAPLSSAKSAALMPSDLVVLRYLSSAARAESLLQRTSNVQQTASRQPPTAVNTAQ